MNEETIGTVVLGFGPQSMDWISKVSKVCGKTAVLDGNVARMAGANLAGGDPRALDLLAEKLKPAALAGVREKLVTLGFTRTGTAGLDEWLAFGDRGASSNAMAAHLFGEPYFLDGNDRNAAAHPYDADDFSRCMGLIDAAPFLEGQVPRMAQVSPIWSLIAEQWPRLTDLWKQGTKESRSEISTVLRGITRPGS